MNLDRFQLLIFRPWFYAAAVDNLVRGTTFVLTPGPVVRARRSFLLGERP
jgi:hypothetical protein